MRARVFLKIGAEPDFELACELEAEDADDVWRLVEAILIEPGGASTREILSTSATFTWSWTATVDGARPRQEA
jgi:hypothetical protein